MKEQETEPLRGDRTAADWYLESCDAGSDDHGRHDRSTAAFAAWSAIDPEHADAIARCDAVMALAPKLADSPDVAWAFAEAGRLARTPPPSARPAATWYRRPRLAWASAAMATAAAAVLAILHWLPQPQPIAEPATPVTNVTFAPIIVPSSIDQIRRLAEIDPVVSIANEMTVDGRSLVVLPFSIARGADRTDARGRSGSDMAQTVYLDLVRQLAGMPGVYVIEPSTAAVWTDTELSPEQIAFSLGVRGVVQGRVGAIDDDVVVDVRFTDAARDGLVFDEAYERPISEIAMIRDDITSGLLDAMTGPGPATY